MSQFKDIMLDMEDDLVEIIESTPAVTGGFNGRNAIPRTRRKVKIKEKFLKKHPNARGWFDENWLKTV
jgi:hypothetical protein